MIDERGVCMETEEQSIYGLFLEVQPKPSQRQAYLDYIDKLSLFRASITGFYNRIGINRSMCRN
jgi:hypothetical protein